MAIRGARQGLPPQLPSILSGYSARPAWHVAGVDYGVGYPSGTTLTDWSTMSGAGITVGANSVEISGQASVVVDSIDFSLHGGACLLLFTGSNNATVSKLQLWRHDVVDKLRHCHRPLNLGAHRQEHRVQ